MNTTNTAGVDKGRPQKNALLNFGNVAADTDANCLSLDALTGTKDLLSSKSVEPGISPQLKCDEKMPTGKSDETNNRKVESNLDIASEDLSSDSSDYCGEGDEDVSVVNKKCLCFQ